MKFNPDIHKRKSIRLKNYDYSKKGLYFITISIKDKLCLFGNIVNNNLELFESGKMVEKYWINLENKYEHIKLHDYVIMPNHFHGIIEISKQKINCDCKICRGTPCGYPDEQKYEYNILKNYFNIDNKKNYINQATYKGCPYNKNLIGNIVGGFKSITTNKYIKYVRNNNWLSFNEKLWQKNYYEHIIKNEKSYFQIVEYIKNNPLKWEEDKFYYTEI